MRAIYLALAIACLVWVALSFVGFLFLYPSTTGNYAGWVWIVSIVFELGIASIFFSLAEEKKK